MAREFASGMPGPSIKREKSFDEVIANAYRILEEKRRKRLKNHGTVHGEVYEEDFSAQDWYEEYQKEQELLSAKEVAELRRDDDLPSDDDIPF